MTQLASVAAPTPVATGLELRVARPADEQIDEVLAETFPASDPPPWWSSAAVGMEEPRRKA
jgi:hypothetical protein